MSRARDSGKSETGESRRTAGPFLAAVLVGLVFAWACDRPLPTAPATPLTPEAPEVADSGSWSAQSAQPDPPGSDLYEYWGVGDLTFDPVPAPAYRSAGKKSTAVNLCLSYPDCATTLILSWQLREQFQNHENCFGPGEFLPFAGSLRPDRKDPTVVRGTFWFRGWSTDGQDPFKYQLGAQGTVSSPFPPSPGATAVVNWLSGKMQTEGKGKGSKGGNAGSACVGDVLLGGSSLTLVGVS